MADDLLGNVRTFLAGLRREHPELFGGLRTDAGADRESARALLAERTEFWSRRMGLNFRRISVRDQRTVWGSCSVSGSISYNWRLVFAPPRVVDYIVIHELAHLREMNHSRRFWAVVGEHCPEWKEHRRWLTDNYRALRRKRESAALG